MSLPAVKHEFFELKGGLDLMTPPISVPNGKCIDAQNFEPEISGGYRRIDGFERYSGLTAPSAATYYTITITLTGAIAVSDTITGASSGATGKVLAISGTTYVLGRVTGTFTSGENVTVSAVVQGSTASLAALGGAATASLDADYLLLAANDRRASISAVPGSGRIRGVWVYNDTVYAFRDNAGGTAGDMYKDSGSGWTQVTFGTEIQFSSTMGGTTAFAIGNTIGNLGAAPTKTATIVAVLLRTGTMGTDGVGTLIITPVTGSFADTDPIYVGATQKAVATSAATAITRAPGGQCEFVNANFTGSTSTQKMYIVDGVNKCAEFDGTTYIPIRTGMTTDTPSHVMAHKNYLFLSFLGSAQYSSLGNPYSWTVILGAGEIATGDTITGFLPQGSDASGSSMAIFTSKRTHILYGSSSADWRMTTSVYDIGYSAFTMQPVSNNTYGLTARGVQSLLTTLTYGDFDYASITHLIQSMMTLKRGLETCSTSIKTKDQYRLYFNDGTGLIVGLTGDQVSGLMPINYGSTVVRCICTATLSTGAEVTYFGSDDGYIYKDQVGTSFDGSAIEAWVRPVFNHSRSPQMRKRYRRAVFEVKATGYCQVQISYDLGYGTITTNQGVQTTKTMIGGGGYWDQFTWDQFTWDAQIIETQSLSIEGTEKNISFIIYNNRAQDQSFTVQGISLMFTPRRMER